MSDTPPRLLRQPKTWQQGTIRLTDDTEIDVKFVPLEREKRRIAVTEEGDLFVWETRREIWMSISHGIYTLMRRDGHIGKWYSVEELPTLKAITAELRDLDSEFIGLLSSTPEDEKDAIQMRLANALRRMGSVENYLKQQAKHQMVFVLPLVDSQGRVNQGVFRCRTNKAIRDIEDRLEEITGIRPWVLHYEANVVELAGLMEERTQEIYILLKRLYRQLGGLGHEPKIKHAHTTVRQINDLTASLCCKPYTNTATHLARELPKLCGYVMVGNMEAALTLVVTMGNSVKLKPIRRTIELSLVPLFDEYPGTNADEQSLGDWIEAIVTIATEQVIEPLSEIDENNFIQPVKQDAITLVEKTIEALQAEDTVFSAKVVGQLKDQVKHAAGML